MSDPRHDRRHVLKLAAASAAGLWLPRSAWSQARWQSDPFAIGVASGSPTHDSLVLWTRLVQTGLFGGSQMGSAPVAVRWEMADDAQFQKPVRAGQTLAVAELAHTVHVEVDGLAPDRWYYYRFIAGDAVSPVGRTRTFPAPGAAADRLRLAYASCQRWEHGYFSAWRHMRAENVDAVLFLGDYIYEYPGAADAVRVPTGGWVVSLQDYRDRYALHRREPDLQAMHAACPWLVTWDDHEVQNDYAGLVPGYSGTPVADFAARRAAAYQAFYEHMPLRSGVLTAKLAGLSSGAEMRIHGQVPFGRLANLYLLDDRQYRDAQVCTRGGRSGASTLDPRSCADWDDPQRSLLGPAQERWLDARLAQAGGDAVWNVIGQQTLFGRRNLRPSPAVLLWNDGWDGYEAARGRLTASLQRHAVPNPVLLGGDLHENWVGHVKADYTRPDSAALGVEFCGTSITSRAAPGDRIPALLAENPHFVFADNRRKGYGVVEFTPTRLTTMLRVVDDVRRVDTQIETLARFEVQAGRQVIERV